MPQNNSLFVLLRRSLRTVLFLAPVFLLTLASAADEAKVKFDVAAGEAGKTLKQFAQQAKREIMFPAQPVGGVKTNAVQGELTVREALDRLLDGTELRATEDTKTGALMVQRYDDPNGQRVAQKDSDHPSDQSKVEEGKLVLDTFEVMGTKLLNMDIPRSRDDVQPYVIYNRATIEQSGAVNLEDFLKQRLTMNTIGSSFSQGINIQGNMSQINLRGLGTTQTMILIDGRRTVQSQVTSFGPQQSDLNGIPLAAIERVEILPTTASGIYGGSATGGVINVVLRRNYAGMEVKVTYDNTFKTDTANRRIDLSAGFTLENGKTNVLLAASYADGQGMRVQDRDLLKRGRAMILANNPGNFLNAATPLLGATANIRSVNGSPLFGPGTSNITSVPVGYAGGGGLAPLQANAGRLNFDLANSAQSGGGGRNSLLNTPTIETGSLTVRRQFSPQLQTFLELSATNNFSVFHTAEVAPAYTVAATAPNNPFGQAIRVTVPLEYWDEERRANNMTRRVAGGVILKLPGDWSAEADVLLERARTDYFSNEPHSELAAWAVAVGNGTVDVLRDLAANPLTVDFTPYRGTNIFYLSNFRTTSKSVTLRAAGPVWQLPAGALRLSALLEARDDQWSDAFRRNFTANGDFTYVPSRSQSIYSGYMEFGVPLISKINPVHFIKELEFQASVRHDEYTVDGAEAALTVLSSTGPYNKATIKNKSSDFTAGLKYKPAQDLVLRASYGTGFLPPSVQQTAPRSPSLVTGFPAIDPRRGNTPLGPFLSSQGGGNLKPEKSKSWSAGLVWTPQFLPRLRLSVDYTNIEKTDNIVQLATQVFIDNESLWPEKIDRGPSLPTDLPGWAGPIIALRSSNINIARASVEAFDVQLDYSLQSKSAGTVDFFTLATWQTHYLTQLVPTLPVVENVGVANNPLKLKANAGFTWKRARWTAGWTARYFDSYFLNAAHSINLNQGSARIRSQVYHDGFVGYSFGSRSSEEASSPSALRARLLDRTEIQVGINNLFNERPPFDAGNANLYSPYGNPRLSSYYFMLRKQF